MLLLFRIAIAKSSSIFLTSPHLHVKLCGGMQLSPTEQNPLDLENWGDKEPRDATSDDEGQVGQGWERG